MLGTLYAVYAYASVPITTDSRIKTLVYNENEVFHLTLHYGYQSNIEFAKNEEIETISLGNSYSWKITPIGRRLFIKPLEGAAKTNMTVITDKQTYQFEIESKDPDDNLDEDLVYVVRFFYPDGNLDMPLPKVDTKRFLPRPPVDEKSAYNFNYSLSGSDRIAPIKVFDDGRSIYLQFPNNNAFVPNIYKFNEVGIEQQVTYSRKGEYIVVKGLASKLALRINEDVTYVYRD